MDLQVSVCPLKCCTLAPVPGRLFEFVGAFLTRVKRVGGVEFCRLLQSLLRFLCISFLCVHDLSSEAGELSSYPGRTAETLPISAVIPALLQGL